ncbi:hybrid sensor histidine kinase/response regulator, partial [Singulisphaera rosea]
GTIATYFDRPHRPSDRETRLVELYGRQAAEFIENAQLYRQIREADRRKDEFLAMLAHELRNPLAPILNALHYLRSNPADVEALEQARAIAERQVRHLARLVDDLLDVSRISSGKIQLRMGEVILEDMLARAMETSRPLIEARRHELTCSIPSDLIILEADAARLEQVFSNLLNNAAKYTEEGGQIGVTAEQVEAEVVIRIRDTGIGIAPELLPRVFDLFTQETRSLDRSQGGLGIGLTLVRRLVEMHRGQVRVQSEGLGRGSEFIVTLPVAPTDPDRARRLRSAPRNGAAAKKSDRRTKRILVVDDNTDGAAMLARILRSWGHDVTVAHDGPTAIASAREELPEVVLLDIGLPGMDGYEVAKQFRGPLGLENGLLVALTGYGQGEDRRRSREAGFDQHLVKPVDPDVLKQMLDGYQPTATQETGTH